MIFEVLNEPTKYAEGLRASQPHTATHPHTHSHTRVKSYLREELSALPGSVDVEHFTGCALGFFALARGLSKVED